MKLYEEIVFLSTYYTGVFCVENVIPYYPVQFNPQIIGRHCLWSNFLIPDFKTDKRDIGKMCGKNQRAHKIPLEERNAVDSDLGLHIFNMAFKHLQMTFKDMELETRTTDNKGLSCDSAESAQIADATSESPIIVIPCPRCHSADTVRIGAFSPDDTGREYKCLDCEKEFGE